MLQFLDELKNLNLPIGQYAIFGSGPLSIRNLRESDDLDIIVKPELWDNLTKKYPPVTKQGIKEQYTFIPIGNIEIFNSWVNLSGKINEMIDTAEIIEGFPFVKLGYVKEWKTFMGRDKDNIDLKLIEEYLNKPTK
ncbi:MAG: hypothetical protein NTX82_03755 [Candidatus Parcubacteria bacterium]|nr:hypothetical protein [Candidatus Parcubacteria bacterium]